MGARCVLAGARVYIAPLYWHAQQRGWRVGMRTRRALEWWLRFLAAAPARLVPVIPCNRDRILLFTDAAGSGRLAWVAETPWGRFYSAVEVTLRKWVLGRKTQACREL